MPNGFRDLDPRTPLRGVSHPSSASGKYSRDARWKMMTTYRMVNSSCGAKDSVMPMMTCHFSHLPPEITGVGKENELLTEWKRIPNSKMATPKI